MLVDHDPEVPARRFSLISPQYGPTRSPLLNPSLHVIWAADVHHVQGDFQDRHQATLQRHTLQGPMLVVESAWMTLDLASSTDFIE
jgi:hypothetical protein